MKRFFLAVILTSVLTACSGIPNASEKEVAISGNCGMCKETIEKAANKEGEVQLIWDPATKKATVTFDATKTSVKEILRRVATAGYDNESFKADAAAYEALHACCQYDR